MHGIPCTPSHARPPTHALPIIGKRDLMALSEFVDELDQLAAAAHAAFAAATDSAAIETARVEFLGAKNGRLKAAQKGLATVAPPDKPAAGRRFNEVKQLVESALRPRNNAWRALRPPTLDPRWI